MRLWMRGIEFYRSLQFGNGVIPTLEFHQRTRQKDSGGYVVRPVLYRLSKMRERLLGASKIE